MKFLTFLSFFFLTISAVAEEKTAWQLRLNVNLDGTLELYDARPVGNIQKKLVHPGGPGAPIQIPIELDWVNPLGQTVFSTETLMPLGRRMPHAYTRENPNFLSERNHVVLRVYGPSADASISSIRVSDQRTASTSLAPPPPVINNSGLPTPGSFGVQILPMKTRTPMTAQPASRSVSPPPGPVQARQIQSTGNDENRLVLVIMGDGYTETQINDGTFADDVQLVIDKFADYPPWDEMLKVTNIYEIEVISNESGADYEDSKPGTEVDTFFDTGFFFDGIERLLVARTLADEDRAVDIADDFVGPALWDQIILIVNSDKYGGSGGLLATNSMNVDGPDISVHEIGHSLVGLTDEYEYAGETHDGTILEVNADTNGNAPKWSHWIEEGTPLPTPETQEFAGVVGAFEGAHYAEFGAYRPVLSCMMRDLGSPFCPICSEAFMLELFERIDYVDASDPDDGVVNVLEEFPTFVHSIVPLNNLDIAWSFNDVVEPGQAGLEGASLSALALPGPTDSIRTTITYDGPLIRLTPPTQVIEYTVNNMGQTAEGTPRWWLAFNGLSTADGTGDIDHDNDGVITKKEFSDQTDPNDPQDFAEPPIVTNVIAEDNAGGTFGILVSWDALEGAVSYNLYRNTDNDFETATRFPITLTDPSGINDQLPDPGDIFYYWVTALLATGDETAPSEPDAGWIAKDWNISAISNSNTQGTVEGGGILPTGTTATLVASPNPGFRFVSWQESLNDVATTQTYEFTVEGDRNLVAIFEAIPDGVGPVTGLEATDGTFNNRIIVSWNASNSAETYNVFRNTEDNFETASRVGFDLVDTSLVDFSASPGTVYFYWVSETDTSGNISLPSDPETGFIPAAVQISASVNDSARGDIVGAGAYTTGETVRLIAAPASGFRFLNWVEGDQVLSTNTILEFTATGDRTLTAVFAASVNVTATGSPLEGGTVVGSGSYAEGALVTLTATPAEGYRVDSWSVEGATIASGKSYAFTAREDIQITANFARSKVFIEDSPDGTAPAVLRSGITGTVWERTLTQLFVSVSGSEPLSFQWARDGVDIVGATSQVLDLQAVGLTEGGPYSVTISNAFGEVTESGILTVRPLPVQPGAELFSDAQEIKDQSGRRWAVVDWLGTLYLEEFPWIYHPQFGWIYMQTLEGERDRFFGYHLQLGWLWFAGDLFRDDALYIWRFDTQSFIAFGEIDAVAGVAWFYQFATESWIAVPLP